MALDLFKRVETRKGLFAVEKITLIYNLLTSILILFLFQEMDHPVQMLADRVVIAGMTFLLMYLYRLAPCKFSAFVRIAIQMSLLSYWYPDTFEFNRIFPNLDHMFASVEQWMFGGQPAVWFCERFPQMWVSEPFNMGYFFYYPMILLVVVWYFLYRFDLFEKVSFVIVTAFFIYYLIYIFVPVAGPQFYFPAIGSDHVAQGIFPSIGDYFHGCFSQFARRNVYGTDDYGMAWQQASVCLLVSFLSAVVRGYGLYPGTLPDRLYRGFRIGFRHLYPGHVDVQAMVCAADVPLVGHGDYLSTVCGQYQCTRINFCRK